ncbi:hypothetical protein MA9V1_208 [Chryseobacterium phage MA9V-1]|nr:hypothetical protein MA9V1_208 [Chryseobacterium phage MA9V-1]
MTFTEIFSEEIIAEFRAELAKIKKSQSVNMFTEPVIDAYEDILECIENGSINDIDELEDYIDIHYGSTEEDDNEYFIICSLTQYADGDFDDVHQIFKQATLSKKKINLEELLAEEGDTFAYEDEF